jgi:acyl-[acyl carrier protein]--UDP-N-acetylglucosamine O-acyltransferase
MDYYVHPTAVVDDGAVLGKGTRVWHFVHIMPGAEIGEDCAIGQGCYIANVKIGSGVRIQNHVSVYDSVTLEDDVFCGPSCVFTNVINPRSAVQRKEEFKYERKGENNVYDIRHDIGRSQTRRGSSDEPVADRSSGRARDSCGCTWRMGRQRSHSNKCN